MGQVLIKWSLGCGRWAFPNLGPSGKPGAPSPTSSGKWPRVYGGKRLILFMVFTTIACFVFQSKAKNMFWIRAYRLPRIPQNECDIVTWLGFIEKLNIIECVWGCVWKLVHMCHRHVWRPEDNMNYVGSGTRTRLEGLVSSIFAYQTILLAPSKLVQITGSNLFHVLSSDAIDDGRGSHLLYWKWFCPLRIHMFKIHSPIWKYWEVVRP